MWEVEIQSTYCAGLRWDYDSEKHGICSNDVLELSGFHEQP